MMAPVADAGNLPYLLPFIFSQTQSYVLEFGNAYIRFYSAGAPLLNGDGTPYQVSTPYAIADIPLLKYSQSADVLTLTHPSYPTAQLKRLGALSWTYAAIPFGVALPVPTGITATADPGTAAGAGTSPPVPSIAYAYTVTAFQVSTSSESLPGTGASCSNYSLSYYGNYGNFNTVSWSAVAGADYYKIYKLDNGILGYIGQTTSLTFADTNIAADTTTTPPLNINPFTGGNDPAAVTYFQQRAVYAGGNTYPETIWLSQSGNYNNFNYSEPSRDTDAVTLSIASQQINTIKFLVPLQDMIIMTYGGIFKLAGGSSPGEPLTPSSTVCTAQVFTGCADVVPIVINYDLLYVERSGQSIRDLSYNFYANLYTGSDISMYSDHLFYGYSILNWSWSEAPFKQLWAVRSDGALLSLCWDKEENVYGWAKHITQGSFHSVCVIPETINGVTEDVPYFVVQRSFGAFVERMHTRLLGNSNTNLSTAWYLDCALQYSGAPVTTVTGLTHLNGQTVNALADGVPVFGLVVSGGSVTVPRAASTITVGLAYQGIITTLPITDDQTPLFGRRKRLSRATMMVENTAGIQVSTDGVRYNAVTGLGGNLNTGSFEVYVSAYWDGNGQISILQNNPLPMTILGVTLDIEVGSS